MSVIRYTERTPYVTSESMLERLRTLDQKSRSEDPPKADKLANTEDLSKPRSAPVMATTIVESDSDIDQFLKANPDMNTYLKLSEKLRSSDPTVEQPPIRVADLEYMRKSAESGNPLMQTLSDQIVSGVESKLSGSAADRRTKVSEKNAALKNLQDMLEAQLKFNWQAKSLEESEKRRARESAEKMFTVASREAASYIKNLESQGLLTDRNLTQSVLAETNAWAREQLDSGMSISAMDMIQRIQDLISGKKIQSGAGVVYTRDAKGNFVPLYTKPSGGRGGSPSPKRPPRTSILSDAKSRAGK